MAPVSRDSAPDLDPEPQGRYVADGQRIMWIPDLSAIRSMTSRATTGSRSTPPPPTAAAAAATSASAGYAATNNVPEDQYNEDGLRDVWDSAPDPEVHASRCAWREVALRDKVSWSQTSDEVDVWIKLPKGSRKRDVEVSLQPEALCVKLGWYGRFLDGPLRRRVKSRESTWCFTGPDEARQFEVMHIMMPKDEPHWWRSLFEGGEEKSHLELLKEAVEADEPIMSYDDMDDGAREILEDLRERQAMVVNGMINLETSFDDFRVAIGDDNL